jgi:tripartite-type tricarboxylate transporter receptor subunit TctC
VAQGRLARFCSAQRPAEGDRHEYETAIKKIWDSAEFREFMNRRGFDIIYQDSAGFAAFMKADNEDNGEALKSLGLAK